MSEKKISTLKGFRDSLPKEERKRQDLLDLLSKTLETFCFQKIDTPILESSELLFNNINKDTEKQVYRFEDNGGRDIGLRFDLTLPLSRFVENNFDKIVKPFKRYQYGKVFRGEKTQKGRYREFIQFDFDTVYIDNHYSDFNILDIVYQSMKKLGLENNFKIHISSRSLINDFLTQLQLFEKQEDIFIIIDKFQKIGKEQTLKNLQDLIQDEDKSKKLIEFINLEKNNDDMLLKLKNLLGQESPSFIRFSNLYSLVQNEFKDFVIINPAIIRGLGYYTGFVYETFINDFEDIGSVCSGGRYDKLVHTKNKGSIPGVGGSFGIDRLLSIEKLFSLSKKDKPSFLITCDSLEEQYNLARYYELSLKEKGFLSETYLIEESKLKKKYQYAQEKDFDYIIVLLSPKELENGQMDYGYIKKINEQDSFKITQKDIISLLESLDLLNDN